MTVSFQGFQESRKQFTGIPEQFFSELLPLIDDLDELKVVLYVLWAVYANGDYGTLFLINDLLHDELFSRAFSTGKIKTDDRIKNAVKKAIDHHIFITGDDSDLQSGEFFINSPRGRQAAKLHFQGRQISTRNQATLNIIRPNIFRYYEENIGPLTPLIAETLGSSLEEYSEEWIMEAIQIAVKNNVRRWSYISSILTRWQEEGRDGTNRKDHQEDYRRYLKGEYGDFGQH